MERELDNALSEKVAEFIAKATDKKSFVSRVTSKFDECVEDYLNDVSKYKTKLQKEEILVQKSYEEYSLGKVDRETYLLKREIAFNHINTINNEIISVENILKDIEREKNKAIKWIKDVFSAKSIDKIPGDLIHGLIEKIIVYGNHNFEIVFKFNIDKLSGGVGDE